MRTSKTVNGVRQEYYYDENGQLLYEIKQGVYELYYKYDADGNLFSITRYRYSDGAKHVFYAITNSRGDVIELRENSGAVYATYTYDSWGRCVSVKNSSGNACSVNTVAVQSSIRYRGYVYDYETGLYYLQSRYYDAETGRFLNADDVDYIPVLLIVKGVANLYSYCWNNPISYEDATGCLIWPGEIHNKVIDKILDRNSDLNTQRRVYYGDGKYGYCDIVDFHRKEMWEVKRYLRNTTKQAKRYDNAVKQLKKYTRGYCFDDEGDKIYGFKIGRNRLGSGTINNYKNYFIEYWYEGQGIIVYDYFELNTKRAYEPITFSVPTTINETFLVAIMFLIGLMNTIGGRASPKYA